MFGKKWTSLKYANLAEIRILKKQQSYAVRRTSLVFLMVDNTLE
jgi:hypothetical protein